MLVAGVHCGRMYGAHKLDYIPNGVSREEIFGCQDNGGAGKIFQNKISIAVAFTEQMRGVGRNLCHWLFQSANVHHIRHADYILLVAARHGLTSGHLPGLQSANFVPIFMRRSVLVGLHRRRFCVLQIFDVTRHHIIASGH